MIEKINIYIPSPGGFTIDTDIIINRSDEIAPVVIFAHGFKGFKDWGGFPYMMNRLSEAGFTAVSFNFTHNGVEKQSPVDFTRLDLFAENTHTKELADLRTVIDYVYNNAEKFNGDKDKIALMGHSRGGGAVILAASEDKRIKSLVTLASVATVNRYTEEQKKRWKDTGYIEIPNTRTNQMMRMNKLFLDDIEANSGKLDITKAAGNIKIPWLIIHGREDLAVKYTDAEKLYENSNKDSATLNIIDNTGHTFGAVHPFKGTTKAFDGAISESIKFLKRTL